jgi:hypothetical protein
LFGIRGVRLNRREIIGDAGSFGSDKNLASALRASCIDAAMALWALIRRKPSLKAD